MTSRHSYHDSHPSINASMDDFEAREFSPTMPDLPSQHSGFRSNNLSDYSENSSRRSHSPPAWRKAGSGWFKHQSQSLSPIHAGYGSKEPSPQYHSAEEDERDVTARWIPLPASPVKGRSPSPSPAPEFSSIAGALDEDVQHSPFQAHAEDVAATPTQSNCKSVVVMFPSLINRR